MRDASVALSRAGLRCDVRCGAPTETLHEREPNTQIGKALMSLKNAMSNAKHSVYRGSVYRKYVEGSYYLSIYYLEDSYGGIKYLLKRTPLFFIAAYAYERMCSAEEYLHSILAVSDIQDDIINHLSSLTRILGNNYCNVSRCVFVLATFFLAPFFSF